MTIVDNYFPFDTGPGSSATASRWRLMARVWQGSGVIANYLNNMSPSIAGSVVTINTGAVWIDGYYGEIDSPKTVSISGNVIVVARMDPTARQILLTSVTTPTQTLTGIYEVPLARVTSGTLVDIRQFAGGAGAIQPGLMMDHGGGTAPPGWLLCNGASYLRTDFPGLFTAIGTTWGAADGTHFSVPNLTNRFTMGAGTSLALGSVGGSTTISPANLPPHVHTGSGNTSGESGPHNHSFPATGILTAPTPGTGNITVGSGPDVNDVVVITGLVTSGENAAHVHSFSFTSSNGPGTSAAFLPPAAGVTKVIKT